MVTVFNTYIYNIGLGYGYCYVLQLIMLMTGHPRQGDGLSWGTGVSRERASFEKSLHAAECTRQLFIYYIHFTRAIK